MPCSPPRRRLAIGRRQHVQQQLLVLAVLVLDLDVLAVQLLDHAVERRAQGADLVARAHRHLGAVVAGREARHAGGELAQRPEQRARQPGAGHDHDQQREAAHDQQVALQLVDRREGLGRIDLGDQRPLDAGDRQRPPGGERRDAAIADDLAGALDAGKSGLRGIGRDALMQHRRAVAADGFDVLVRLRRPASARRNTARGVRRRPAGRSARNDRSRSGRPRRWRRIRPGASGDRRSRHCRSPRSTIAPPARRSTRPWSITGAAMKAMGAPPEGA